MPAPTPETEALIHALNKVDATLQHLTRDVTNIAHAQRQFQSRSILSSAAAYLIFTALTFTALYVAFTIRMNPSNDNLSRTDAAIQTPTPVPEKKPATAPSDESVKTFVDAISNKKISDAFSIYTRLPDAEKNGLSGQLMNAALITYKPALYRSIYDTALTHYQKKEFASVVETLTPIQNDRELFKNEDARFLFVLGHSYFKIDDMANALRYLQPIITEYPKSTFHDDALYVTGLVYEKQGQSDKAADLYAQLIRAHKDSPFANDCKSRYQALTGRAYTSTAAHSNT